MTQQENIKNSVWRPEAITEDVLAKLEFAFARSFTDVEASLYANISPATLYRYIDANPEFWERKETLKKQPNIQAKLNWYKKIESEDYNASKDWLERKSRDEFSLKQEVDNKLSGSVNISNIEIL